jgi:hypothetical protein
MMLTNQLLRVEEQLWRNDAALYQHNLLEDAVLIFPETGPITRKEALQAIRGENLEGRRWAEVRIDSAHSVPITKEVALLTYRVAARWEHEESPVTALASSLYVKRNSSWKLAFHQQTPVDARRIGSYSSMALQKL